MHDWYKRACRLGLRSLGAPHHKDVFGLKGPQINDIMFNFEDIQQMFRLSQLGSEMVRLWCMCKKVPHRLCITFYSIV